MQLIIETITLAELREMSKKMHGNLVKAVVDIEKEIMAVDAELHADQEQFLLEQGSEQGNLWGINIYPDAQEEERIEFDSMINLRPSWGNCSRGVDNPETRGKIIEIVYKRIIL